MRAPPGPSCTTRQLNLPHNPRSRLYTAIRLTGLAALKGKLPSPLESAIVLRADAILAGIEARQ